VTNETGGDISVVDVALQRVVATIPVGKRPRGIRLSPDGTNLFVALSGSPMAPPGTDESKLPPPDRKADGIGVVSVADLKLLRVLPGGLDPEQSAVSADGTKLFVANEDGGPVTGLEPKDFAVDYLIPTPTTSLFFPSEVSTQKPDGFAEHDPGTYVMYVTTTHNTQLVRGVSVRVYSPNGAVKTQKAATFLPKSN